ncbi:MAG: ABC transporter substrate-binding protein, partial [Actinomycetes bacterium]
EVVAPDTVRLTCAFACPDLGPITLAYVPVLPQHLFEGVAKPAEHTGLPVGTGPYRLVDHSATGGYRFTANESYFAGAPLVRELVMPIVPNVNATFTALRTGEIDASLRSVPPELVDQFEDQPGLQVVKTKPLKFTELRMNFVRPPFDVPELDPRVRAEVLGVMSALQNTFGLAYLFITHDLAVADSFCHRLVVMARGAVVEEGPAEDVVGRPRHAATIALVEAARRLQDAVPA